MPSDLITGVMVHVGNVEQGLAWYAQAFPLATREKLANSDFEFLRLGSFLIEIVSSDHKVSSGPSGSVVYWQVNCLEAEVKRLAGLGAKLYRGPLQTESNWWMCQMQDPWGNCIGLRGP